ncbi:MAG: orotidine-5'-phosphate decarboxylase [Patescibacteria group bacterium]|nr:orotidine-5'-phosphate decarboxylase [Patescibacteria group bacterium]
MERIGFRKMLEKRQDDIGSLVCVGLDPLAEKVPVCIKREMWLEPQWKWIARWMCDIVDATAPHASMFKPQKAHYEAFEGGRLALQAIVSYIHAFHPDIPVFLDCKRGDIGRTQQQYRFAHFEIDGVDGVNFNPYMGKDCMEHFVDTSARWRSIVGLCYTSNSAAREVQDIVIEDGRYLWERIAELMLGWAKDLEVDENAGLVMAAAYEKEKGSGEVFSWHLSRCREIVSDRMWFLIPGIGAQEGFARQTVLNSGVDGKKAGPGEVAINSSSKIDFASDGEDYAEAAGVEVETLMNQIRRAA